MLTMSVDELTVNPPFSSAEGAKDYGAKLTSIVRAIAWLLASIFTHNNNTGNIEYISIHGVYDVDYIQQM